MTNKFSQREIRHHRIRGKIHGTATRPRLFVFRSGKHIYAQLIDDNSGSVLGHAVGAKTLKGAKDAGKIIAKKSLEEKIERIVFDRGGYKYHGRVKALAEGARDGGLKF